MRWSLLFILIVTVICPGCKKNHTNAGEAVEIYLLKTYRPVTGRCQVDSSGSVLEDSSTIRNRDILEYSETYHQFKLTNAAIQKVKAFTDKMPFAVTVEKQVIYYGVFKPNISSSSCDHSITMDLDWTSTNKISLTLGYPEGLQGISVDDKRNDPKLIAALKKQGKLKY